ncbi:chromaffin granule amine transporter [Manduca sexta]|uniref:chromaffin granule amine transporter n=1 Tax=Manduca sexta TaxID=7130 RepID=UPI00188FA84F|nr:chromaffin granule amine transporter [Manduca sexta]
MERGARGALIAFALIYVTFFLDNVLLTVLVPIIPDWVRGESLELWTRHDAKAGVQLLSAPLAAAAVCRRGPAPVLRAATALLAIAALGYCAYWSLTHSRGLCIINEFRRGVVCPVFSWCGRQGAAGRVWCACGGRALHGAAAALASVAGLALCAAAVPRFHAARAIGALLGAVALGVLVGYPFGGATYSTWSRGAPFLLIAAALLLDLAAQYTYLHPDQMELSDGESEAGAGECACAEGAWDVRRAAAVCSAGAVRECAGAVVLTTSVMAALEPCLPLWLARRFGSARWQAGAAFVPDSAGYLAAASGAGWLARALGAERVALAGQTAVALAALAIPHAASVSWLALPHVALGCGLGAVDAALVPALLARHPGDAPTLAALLQAASSAAYALGPVVGGVVSWWLGFETALRLLGVLNLLYAAFLYRALCRHPLSEQVMLRVPPLAIYLLFFLFTLIA